LEGLTADAEIAVVRSGVERKQVVSSKEEKIRFISLPSVFPDS
jgi:hypothetical protein